MKKSLTIASLVLAISAIGTSVYASSDIEIDKTNKSSNAATVKVLPATESSKALSADEAAKLKDDTNFTKMAKEKGITLEELFAQLEKEGKVTKAVPSSEATKTTGTTDSTMDSKATAVTQSSEAVSLEEMAKEQGITVDQLIAKLEKEGKLTKAAKTTDSTQSTQSEKINK
ncbi:hypothetical protein [Paenibacillus macquariensis]|uniref:LysM domain-containing protein n=1 Tax=Paenibacillus macquariensis TaxID=948756 RepID=A0ABY1KAF1_9BACL|nr:hypothetical protein [Paenibacillus macquariensis]MEC0093714.1 hypothetical protein [Paenibacillus macquariensis]OAB31661.1 hypothetical protein PMSM_19510 [Paenibacillus macquariensis subsp. macquariensis]SIR50499.1 hypothetical protein SAMN05421578_11677 [Paenibacillus macquariensis]